MSSPYPGYTGAVRSPLEYLPLLALIGITAACFYWFGPLRTSLTLLGIAALCILYVFWKIKK